MGEKKKVVLPFVFVKSLWRVVGEKVGKRRATNLTWQKLAKHRRIANRKKITSRNGSGKKKYNNCLISVLAPLTQHACPPSHTTHITHK